MDRRSRFVCALAAYVTWLPVSVGSNAGGGLAVATESDGGTFKL